ncbi:acyl carrier protein [Paenibacillus sophorae]|uniref:Acyl carrier protein n=1 Tax=Paenibacillus sophorae TaxID=1333845 RepID=A0A1H8KEX7_9BACL|nr:phosphopantetheine-binding protein [Paenibacillus sophorae]QWU13711.1 acyl carrier protein [Paenibacillus sophorae]SEN90998.1 acyl carrier protein [Paenibacillus sophorae]
MFESIKEIIIKVKEDESLRSTLTPESDLINDVGLDSLQMINFILEIEDQFGVEIVYEDLDYNSLLSIERFMDFLNGMEKKIG